MGLAHLNQVGLLHGNLKPGNILVKGALSHVCIGGLGAAMPGDPANRCVETTAVALEDGVREGTLWYRPPEVLLGDASFSFPVDSWAFACVMGELVLGHPVFEAESAVLVANRIFRMFGKPVDEELVKLPHYLAKGPNFAQEPWPPDWLAGQDEGLLAFLRKLWTLSPSRRLTMREACQDKFLQPRRLEVEFDQRSGVHGATTVVVGQVAPCLLRWLQEDPYWTEAIAQLELPPRQRAKKQCLKVEERALNQKHEIAGRVFLKVVGGSSREPR